MPLKHSKSKKAFESNLKTEMKHGKPQDVALAIAYSVKRKASHKKMAEGGGVHRQSTIADREGRSEAGRLARQAKENPAVKPHAIHEHETVLKELRSMAKPKLQKLAHGRMVESDVIKLAKGGQIDPEDQRHSRVDDEMGGSIEDDQSPDLDPADGDDSERTQPVDEFMSTNRMSPMLAEGGHIEEDEDNYADDGHDDSIAAAIMSRRDRLHAEIDSGAHDEDLAAAFADGGEVELHHNADEEPNNEDQMSFQALKKENYSESEGLDDLGDQPEDSNEHGDEREANSENKHDKIDKMRSSVMKKRQFKQR